MTTALPPDDPAARCLRILGGAILAQKEPLSLTALGAMLKRAARVLEGEPITATEHRMRFWRLVVKERKVAVKSRRRSTLSPQKRNAMRPALSAQDEAYRRQEIEMGEYEDDPQPEMPVNDDYDPLNSKWEQMEDKEPDAGRAAESA